MRPPGKRWGPKWGLVFALLCVAACAGWLLWRYNSGLWVPSSRDVGRAVGGLVFGILCGLLDYLRHRQEGDALLRRYLFGQIPGPSFRPAWLLVSRIVLYTFIFTLIEYRHRAVDLPMVLGAALVGLAFWHPLWVARWQRMWELYETEKDLYPVAPPAGPAPASQG